MSDKSKRDSAPVPAPATPLQTVIQSRATLKSIGDGPGGSGATLSLAFNVAPRDDGPPTRPAGFDPWTATEEEAVAVPGGMLSAEFGDWAMAQIITRDRHRIESDGVALLTAIDWVLGRGLVAPRWLSVAFTTRWHRFNALEVSTLDAAFGHRPMDPRTVQAKRRNAARRDDVHRALCAAVIENPGEPIHGGFPYEQVGEAFGIGKTLCFDLYRSAVEAGMQDIHELRTLLKRSLRKQKVPPKSARSPGLKARR